MITGNGGRLTRADLYYAAEYRLVPSGVFQFQDATYSVAFGAESGLLRCLDMMLTGPKPATPRLALRPENYHEERPEWPVASVRFDFEIERQVAAAVLLVLDKNATSHAWMTRGDANHSDVTLTHDSWNPDSKSFPPESFITVTQLRKMLCQWAFGDIFPPMAVDWTDVPHESVGW